MSEFSNRVRAILRAAQQKKDTPLGLVVLTVTIGLVAIVVVAAAELISATLTSNWISKLVERFWAWSQLSVGHTVLVLLVALGLWAAFWLLLAIGAAYLETRPKWSKIQQERDALADELLRARRERQIYFDEMVGLDRITKYGSVIPKFSKMSEVDRAVAVNAALDLAGDLKAAVYWAEKIWRSQLGVQAEMDGSLGILYRWIQDNAYRHISGAMVWLDRDLRAAEDPRPLLSVTYMAYHRWRTWILRLHRMHPINGSEAYQSWQEADATFQADIERAVKRTTQLDSMKRVLERFHEEEGALASLPPLAEGGHSG
jgi:hypothetical protein